MVFLASGLFWVFGMREDDQVAGGEGGGEGKGSGAGGDSAL